MRAAAGWILGAALTVTSIPALGQQRSPTAPPTLPGADDSDDIIVSALRIPREKLPTGVYWSYPSIISARIARENADFFMRCAMGDAEGRWVRAVVDGEPNSATARFSQGMISVTHRGCYPPIRSTGTMNTRGPVTIADIGTSAIDRGAIVERVLKTHAPDAALTPDQTADPAVRDRFVAREGARNRWRLPNDRDALVLASCLVQRQPVLATRLVRSDPGSPLERGLTQAILVEGRSCLGGIRRLTIDPTLARTYIVDAFYRWVVAARGVDSLIPRQG